jgi:hypothetical protein
VLYLLRYRIFGVTSSGFEGVLITKNVPKVGQVIRAVQTRNYLLFEETAPQAKDFNDRNLVESQSRPC